VTGAGATGALPDGAQKAFSDMTGIGETVDEPTGDVTAPEGSEPVLADDDLTDAGDLPEVEAVDGEAAADAFDADLWAEGYDPEIYPSFGDWVSLGAHNKADLQEALAAGGFRNFGAMVSSEAKKKGMDEDELEDVLAEEGVDLGDDVDGETGTETPEDTDVQDTDDDSAKASGNGGKGSGHGKGGGHGKGHGGKN
jgi:hypothetical protein